MPSSSPEQSIPNDSTPRSLPFLIFLPPATTELSKQENPKGFKESAKVAQKGGSVAQAARVQLEHQLGRSVISSAKASDYLGIEEK